MKGLLTKYNTWLLIILGSLVWTSVMFKSGQDYRFGIGFWGPHGHDAVWHLSLINSFASNQWDLPMFAGEKIKNYHFGFDVMVATLVRFTSVPSPTYYFLILPIFFSLTIGFLVYYLTRNIWSVYMTYFATGLGWVIGKGESTFWAQQSLSTLINPPYALSLIFLLLGFIYLKKKKYFLTTVFFGTVGFIKIYAGILGLFTLLFYSVPWFIVSSFLSLVLFLPFNSLSTQTLLFHPLWFVQSLFSDPSRLNWPRFSSALINYRLGGNYLKLIPAALIGLCIFLVGNLGIRILGFYRLSKEYVPLILLGIFFPIFFVQSGTTWNTIQFLYYSMFFLALNIKPKTVILIICTLLLTLPALPATLSQYLSARPPSAIPKSEVETLSFLKHQDRGIVLLPLFDKSNFFKYLEPRPLFAYESTAYVSAYSGQPVFLEDEVNLNILNIDLTRRKQIVTQIFSSYSIEEVVPLIAQNNIRYLYLPDIANISPELSPANYGFTQIFSSGQTQLWQKNRTLDNEFPTF